jgi:hypothetical protein
MTLPVTLEQAKAHLRVVDSEDDSDIADKLLSAQAAVLNYLKLSSLDSLKAGSPANFPAGVDGAVSAATLLLVGYLYRNRDTDVDREWEAGFLPRPVTALLYPLRDPTLA